MIGDEAQAEFTSLVRSFYEDYPMGGPMHIVLDDYNVETEFILWCLRNASPAEREDDRLWELARILLSYHDVDDRHKLCERVRFG